MYMSASTMCGAGAVFVFGLGGMNDGVDENGDVEVCVVRLRYIGFLLESSFGPLGRFWSLPASHRIRAEWARSRGVGGAVPLAARPSRSILPGTAR